MGSGSGPDVWALALQPDGKVVIAGQCVGAINADFCAVRYNGDGTLDSTFGTGGKVITPVGNGVDQALALALQPDGRLVLVGFCAGAFCAVRYDPNGSLDVTFGIGGKAITQIGSGSDAAAHAVAMQPDGNFVLAGYCMGSTTTAFCALRYDASGNLDLSFGTGGLVVVSVGRGDRPEAVALQPDGKLVLAGTCGGAVDEDFCAVRLNGNGTLDNTFGTGGKVITPVGSSFDVGRALVLQPDGKILIAGRCSNGSNSEVCAVRYNTNGAVDETFGASGAVFTAVGQGYYSDAVSVALQPDGKIVFAVSCLGAANADICAVRYNGDGTLDSTFGTGGKVITPVANSLALARAVVLQPDGKVVIGGVCASGQTSSYCAVRYDGGPFGYRICSLDIDGDNRVLATTDSLIHARIALGITGNAVVSGITFPPNAKRNTWPLIRDYLVRQCGMSLLQ